MSTTALAILGDGYQIAITPEAEQQKRTILEAARRVVAVTDQDTCDLAQSRLRSLGSVRTAVESSRKQVKAPVLELGKRIDGIAAEFVADVITEETRLSGLVAEYAREVQRKAREEREAAERERLRIEREEHERKLAAMRAEQEAERQRMEAERAAHAAEMERLRAARAQDAEAEAEARKREEAAAAAQLEAAAKAEAARIAAEEAQAKAERERQEAEARAAAAVAAPVPQGVSEEIDFEVTDILAFVAKFPQLCRIEPKRAEILAALKKSFAAKGKLPDVPGLRVFQNLKVKGRRN
jgi:hypothetical protein